MGKKIIEIIDSVHCKANPEAREAILKNLKYKSLFYRKTWARNQYGKASCIGKKTETTSYLITGRKGTSGTFLSGLLPRVSKNKDIKIVGEFEKIKPTTKTPSLDGIKFRKDQITALRKIRRKQRGVILFPTGSGKTIIASGIMSMYSDCRILFLCHTKELLTQTSEELTKFGMNHFLLGNNKIVDWEKLGSLSSCILISTIQSFSKVKKELWMSFFDITIVDEVHNAAKEDSQYGKVMQYNLAPIKIGFTATLPSTEHEKLVVEGFFGPVISELTLKEGERIGIIAKAKVNLIPVPYQNKLSEKSRPTYNEMYKLGIVENKLRNKLIVEEAKKTIADGKRCLIIVEKIEHGNILKNLFKEEKIICPFVQGKSESDFRNAIKTELKERKRKVAICTRVWKEGVNIPSLDHIIYAPGMKEEKAIKQAMGRGLRIAKDKSTIQLTDFMDPYPYLAQHSIMRFTVYKELGWIK